MSEDATPNALLSYAQNHVYPIAGAVFLIAIIIYIYYYSSEWFKKGPTKKNDKSSDYEKLKNIVEDIHLAQQKE